MKEALLFFVLTINLCLKSQTTLYFTKPDGSIDKNSFWHVTHSSGLVIVHDKNTSFKSDTSRSFLLIVEANNINCIFKDASDKAKDVEGNLGRLDPGKKIIDFRGPPCYIKDSKIYSSDNKVLAYIEGEEIYGAALYLLHD